MEAEDTPSGLLAEPWAAMWLGATDPYVGSNRRGTWRRRTPLWATGGALGRYVVKSHRSLSRI